MSSKNRCLKNSWRTELGKQQVKALKRYYEKPGGPSFRQKCKQKTRWPLKHRIHGNGICPTWMVDFFWKLQVKIYQATHGSILWVGPGRVRREKALWKAAFETILCILILDEVFGRIKRTKGERIWQKLNIDRHCMDLCLFFIFLFKVKLHGERLQAWLGKGSRNRQVVQLN